MTRGISFLKRPSRKASTYGSLPPDRHGLLRRHFVLLGGLVPGSCKRENCLWSCRLRPGLHPHLPDPSTGYQWRAPSLLLSLLGWFHLAPQLLQGGHCSQSDTMMTTPRPDLVLSQEPTPNTNGLLVISEDVNTTLNHSMARTRTKTSSASNRLPPPDGDPIFLAAQDRTLLHPLRLPFPHIPHPTHHQVLSALPQEPPVLTTSTPSSAATLPSQHPLTWMTTLSPHRAPAPALYTLLPTQQPECPFQSEVSSWHSSAPRLRGRPAHRECSATSSAPASLPSPLHLTTRHLLPLSLCNAYCHLTEHTLRGLLSTVPGEGTLHRAAAVSVLFTAVSGTLSND